MDHRLWYDIIYNIMIYELIQPFNKKGASNPTDNKEKINLQVLGNMNGFNEK